MKQSRFNMEIPMVIRKPTSFYPTPPPTCSFTLWSNDVYSSFSHYIHIPGNGKIKVSLPMVPYPIRNPSHVCKTMLYIQNSWTHLPAREAEKCVFQLGTLLLWENVGLVISVGGTHEYWKVDENLGVFAKRKKMRQEFHALTGPIGRDRY